MQKILWQAEYRYFSKVHPGQLAIFSMPQISIVPSVLELECWARTRFDCTP